MSSQVNSGSVAPQVEAPTEEVMTGCAPTASIAASTAMFSAGNEPDKLTATRLPGPAPACFSQPTATAAKSG